jgi:hypothetical protein
LVEENDEVVTAISSSGDSNMMVCKKSEENNKEKICMDVEGKSPSAKAKEERQMLDNNTYNLMEQLAIENRSLWRIKNNYKNDAASDGESRQVWSFIEKDKEELIKLLTEKLRERL